MENNIILIGVDESQLNKIKKVCKDLVLISGIPYDNIFHQIVNLLELSTKDPFKELKNELIKLVPIIINHNKEIANHDNHYNFLIFITYKYNIFCKLTLKFFRQRIKIYFYRQCDMILKTFSNIRV